MPRFFETNDANDPGFELSVDEVVTRFWQSDEAEEWKTVGGRLDRTSSGWINRKLGACDRDTLDELLDAVYDGRPR